MNKLPSAKRIQIIGMMVEGMSTRSISDLTGASKNTIVKLLVEAGQTCSEYQDAALRELPCKRLQLNEIWSFVCAKARNVPTAKTASKITGDVWTWTAIDADTKLVASWMVGDRSVDTAQAFVCDLASRLVNRVQVTTDGHKAYIEAADNSFGIDVDYAMLIKLYARAPDGQARDRQPQIAETEALCCISRPDHKHISTSFAERQNLSTRIGTRHFTRIASKFSQKAENHAYALALYFMWNNFGRINRTLRVTPAMAAGVSAHVWSLAEIANLA